MALNRKYNFKDVNMLLEAKTITKLIIPDKCCQ